MIKFKETSKQEQKEIELELVYQKSLFGGLSNMTLRVKGVENGNLIFIDEEGDLILPDDINENLGIPLDKKGRLKIYNLKEIYEDQKED